MSNPVICGPLLRKVTSNSVSVMVALKELRRIKFLLFTEPAGGVPIATAEADTRRIGKKLWVIVISLKELNLVSAVNYYYNLEFYDGITDNTEDLFSLGFLNDNNQIIGVPLGYQQGKLPGFALPPDREHLRIIHGSCRKPHGKGPDQLAALDDLIAAQNTDPLHRPHQLFLTGDQIYADDVDENLFKSLTLTGVDLLGIQEPITPQTKHGHSTTQAAQRQKFIEEQTTFTSDENHHHLVYLAEWYSMYLFAWSGYPLSFSELNSVAFFTDHSQLGEQHEYGTSEVDLYCLTLLKVRRALANIPTYMIFDDHEITDDWYMFGEWKENALNHETTRRIIRNGLIAYSIFQDWGNQPEKYEDLDSFWNEIEYQETNLGRRIQTFSSFPANGFLSTFLGLNPANYQDAHSWFYQLNFQDHQIYVLDSRTRRKYVQMYTKLIDDNEFAHQLPVNNEAEKLTFVISPAPVLGMPVIEDLQRQMVKEAKLLKATTMDDEAWINDPQTFYLLLEHLAQYKQVIILSGDVHYGFTYSCDFFNHLSNSTAKLIQLCSSSSKNSGLLSRIVTWLDHEADQISYAVYPAQEVDHKKLREISMQQLAPTPETPVKPVLLSYFQLNPRNFVANLIISFKDLKDQKYLLQDAMDLQSMEHSYTINYHNNQITNHYNYDDPFEPEEELKILSNSNIGEVTFEKIADTWKVVHQLHFEEFFQPQIFYCKAKLDPPTFNNKPII